MIKPIFIPPNLRGELEGRGIKPVDLVLYINSSCNLRCKHCYVGNEVLSSSVRYEGEQIVDFVNSFATLSRVTVLGGEPLLHKHINSIVSGICEKSVPCFRITTNLTHFGKFDYKLHCNRNLTMCVSVDGHDAATHDLIRGRGTHEKTISNIKALISEGYKIEVTHTIMSSNISHFEKMIELCKSLGVRHINLHRMSLQGNAAKNLNLCVTPTEWVNFRENLSRQSSALLSEGEEKISVRYPVMFTTQGQYEDLVERGEYHPHASGSYYGQGDRIILFPDGKVYVSSEAFGTDAHIGDINYGAFIFNDHDQNELVVFRDENAKISDINPLQKGDEKYPAVLSVSFKKTVYV